MSNDKYYDLTTTGVGFINRFRKVTPDQGDPYYSVTIAALRGKTNNEGNIQKTFINCNVVGEAKEMLKQFESIFEGENNPMVMLKFMFGDLEQRVFVYQNGDRKGETAYSLKGRLFDIKWYKVNGGETVYSSAEIERKKRLESAESSPATETSSDAYSANTVDAGSQQFQVDVPEAIIE